MRDVGKNLDIPLYVFGPETHMTAIVGMAMGTKPVPIATTSDTNTTANFLLPSSVRNTKNKLVFLAKSNFRISMS